MKRSEAAKYARWSAAAALLLACLTVGVYIERKWVAYREKQKAPPPAPQNVTRLSSGLTFSKGEGTQKIFTVEASKVTDFSGTAASLLEDVKITIFGKRGERHDTMHTQSCQYEKAGGGIVCSGPVQIDLQSKAEAEKATNNPKGPADQKVHVETSGMTFNRATGIAQTGQPVKFVFPSGSGEAVGVEYHSEEGAMRLLKDVRLSLLPPPGNTLAAQKTPSPSSKEPVRVKGSSLDFARDSHIMHLLGPAEAETHTEHLRAGELTLTLDAAFRAEKLVASSGANEKKPELESQQPDGSTNLIADTFTAQFAPEGWLTKIEGTGNLHGARRAGTEQDDFSADNGALDLRAKVNQPKELHLKGHVQLKTLAGNSAEARTLQTSELLVEFAEGKKGQGSKLKHAKTLAPGTAEWTEAIPQSGASVTPAKMEAGHTKLQADRLELYFDADGRANQMVATDNVRTERSMTGKPLQIATARSGVAKLAAAGGWTQIDMHGNVKLTDGERTAQAGQALFRKEEQTATLIGTAIVRDATTETQAPRITFNQKTGDIRAEGGVRSTDFAAKGSSAQSAPEPANITADAMQANSKSGRALYTGHARLWQGDSVMEADAIELLREAKIMNATGNVRAVFPQATAQSPAQPVAAQAGPKKPTLWHVTAGTLTYRDAESRAHLEKNVVAQSPDQRMRAAAVDLYFTKSAKPDSNAPNAATPVNLAPGAQQVSRAVGTGGVTVDQGTRKATAEHGEYTAADGKFVMSGGNPTIFDAVEGTTTGRQLTFFLADDTIIVDSENGSRTLTKHRVEK
jgi:lipopolysaccharide export system protein LptA